MVFEASPHQSSASTSRWRGAAVKSSARAQSGRIAIRWIPSHSPRCSVLAATYWWNGSACAHNARKSSDIGYPACEGAASRPNGPD